MRFLNHVINTKLKEKEIAMANIEVEIAIPTN